MDMSVIKECCHFCQFRYGGCGKLKDEALATYETHKCDEFVPGKCYYCSIEQKGNEKEVNSICIDTFYPCGCINFKEGDNYNYFVESMKNECSYSTDKDVIYQHELDNKRRHKRRVGTKKYKKRLKRKADSNKYVQGPFYDEDKKHVIVPARGSRSKWLKRQSNKKIRRQRFIEGHEKLRHADYRRVFDFWWNLD